MIKRRKVSSRKSNDYTSLTTTINNQQTYEIKKLITAKTNEAEANKIQEIEEQNAVEDEDEEEEESTSDIDDLIFICFVFFFLFVIKLANMFSVCVSVCVF